MSSDTNSVDACLRAVASQTPGIECFAAEDCGSRRYLTTPGADGARARLHVPCSCATPLSSHPLGGSGVTEEKSANGAVYKRTKR
jgi:hypothetical protein